MELTICRPFVSAKGFSVFGCKDTTIFSNNQIKNLAGYRKTACKIMKKFLVAVAVVKPRLETGDTLKVNIKLGE